MGLILFLVVVALFVVLTPGILLSLPPKGSKLVVALTHGIVFAVVLKLIYKPLWKFTSRLEGMAEGADGEEEEEEKMSGMPEGMTEGLGSEGEEWKRKADNRQDKIDNARRALNCSANN